MDANAKSAKLKIGDDRWNLIMGSVDSGTLNAQKMHDFAFGLGTTVGGNHTRRVGVEKMKSDRSEMARIFGDWWELDDDFDNLPVQDVAQKLIALFKTDDIRLNPLARALGKTLNANSGQAGARVTNSPSASAQQPQRAQTEPGPAAPGRVTLDNLLKPEVRHRRHDFLANLAYESNFGEDFETYLEGVPPGANPDMKVE